MIDIGEVDVDVLVYYSIATAQLFFSHNPARPFIFPAKVQLLLRAP